MIWRLIESISKIVDQELINHITKESEHQPVQMMCLILKLINKSFHKKPNSYNVANEKLRSHIRVIHNESGGRYSALKIFAILK
ncbi:hypothetical protein [Lysinibacillus sphaericus]|uniref:hypothetical protein n=1 Tax=Lysinibacillus sphaericus TaxID=1421 RepID=UPI001910311A|nr:hypothetical protein [Lysinibacillus sphaericus]QPA54984.1 hypothetical protein INQ53_02760 [Lysinibacillus sphaericus]